MQTLFTIDHGNSHPHVARFSSNQLEEVFPLEESLNILQTAPSIISSVGNHLELPAHVKPLKAISLLKNNKFIEMPIHYSKTLGEDRLIQAAYQYHLKTSKDHIPTLIIDAGTFLTIDLITKDGLQGGHILPGLQVLLDSYKVGVKLPHFNKNELTPLTSLLPQSTETAIKNSVSGIYDSFFQKLEDQTSAQQYIITGGDAELIRVLLNSFFEKRNYQLSRHFIHEALFFCAKEILKEKIL